MIKISRPICPNPNALVSNYKHPDNKKVLIDASHGKCMYCESFVTHIDYGDVEHIKPKSKFPELEFNWENLGFVCGKCNNCKLQKYDEETPYINPYEEDPEEHIIALGSILRHKNGSERGQLSIIDIDLNRIELVEKRQEKLDEISKVIDQCYRTKNDNLRNIALKELTKESNDDKEYSFIVKTLFKLQEITLK